MRGERREKRVGWKGPAKKDQRKTKLKLKFTQIKGKPDSLSIHIKELHCKRSQLILTLHKDIYLTRAIRYLKYEQCNSISNQKWKWSASVCWLLERMRHSYLVQFQIWLSLTSFMLNFLISMCNTRPLSLVKAEGLWDFDFIDNQFVRQALTKAPFISWSIIISRISIVPWQRRQQTTSLAQVYGSSDAAGRWSTGISYSSSQNAFGISYYSLYVVTS